MLAPLFRLSLLEFFVLALPWLSAGPPKLKLSLHLFLDLSLSKLLLNLSELEDKSLVLFYISIVLYTPAL
jgi:hypothetical protein